MKIHYIFTEAKNGGFGVLGKGIKRMFDEDPEIQLTGFQMQLLQDTEPDVVFTYGMPDLFDRVHELRKKYKWQNTKHIHYFVWESSKLHRDHIRAFKKADLLLTSTNYLRLVAKHAGLNAYVWHHAVDSRFQLKETRPSKPQFTFLHHNGYEYRKGTEFVLEAFSNEFYLDEKVKLIIKARERKQSVWLTPSHDQPLSSTELHMRVHEPERFLQEKLRIGHPLIEEVLGHVSDEELVRINSEADVFVFPAKGEGWGLPPFEAAAMGIVPIVPNAGSFKEWFNPDCMISVDIAGYINSEPRYPGYMLWPSTKDLAKKMRWAFENPEKIQQMGIECSAYIHANYNWSKVRSELFQILDKHL